ncbi:MAG: hypothetical protein GX030_04210 [Firmicutes bacterium]|nr:hypothetical protein [Bacillota bacterium]
MICEKCERRPATVHLTQVINGQKTEAHLCQECAAAQGDFGWLDPQSTFQSFLGKVLENEFKFLGRTQPQTIRCRTCGLSYNDFHKLGQLGCADCYAQFSQQLKPLLRKLHGTTTHSGKVPRHSAPELWQQREIEELRGRLSQAIAEENYEEAARLRDLIRAKEAQTAD